ncbi:MAG: transketolase [Alphaproteobacteria bacterium]|nr:transketolase [Alphaproteobacteria bacterium]
MCAAETTADAPGASHADMANAIRALAMDGVQKANSGHPGMPMGMADVATVLFTRFLKIDPSVPNWPDRDRFVLSAGHGSMLQYALHYLVGFQDMTLDQLKDFRQLGSRTAGHPEFGHAAGIETTTGPLGQGLATSVGLALGERMMNARFGDDLVDHHTYVIAGDGCLMEGISHEAIDMAGHLKLGRLIVLWDDNSISIDGSTDLATSTDQLARFAASGWQTVSIDGHDPEAIAAAIASAKGDERPSLIACKTIIGKGSPNKQGTAATHGSPLGDDEIALTREALGWSAAPFEIPEDILNAWRTAGKRSASEHASWKSRLDASPKHAEFEAAVAGALPADLGDTINAYKAKLSAEAPKVATRKSSEMALEVINAAVPIMVGGSADLTGSNNTRTKAMVPVTADNYAGDYLHYGVREFGMAAAMNGIALHGGFIPYGGTFLVFTDYARPAIRLSCLMGQRVIYVMTHDSIGLGEDGPTHQPVEHLASLRAMPNLNVYRPADAVETAECWQAALSDAFAPSVLALSRQGLPTLRTEHTEENLSARGGYVLRDTSGTRDVTILATGSEVEIAVQAAEALASDGIRAAVVSLPCWEKFEAQDQSYCDAVLGTAPRIAVEAAAGFGWEKWLGVNGRFVGMSSFGASAPAGDLYEHFGITAKAAVHAAREVLGRA